MPANASEPRLLRTISMGIVQMPPAIQRSTRSKPPREYRQNMAPVQMERYRLVSEGFSMDVLSKSDQSWHTLVFVRL